MQYNRSSFSDSNNSNTEHYWNDHRERNVGYADNDPLLKDKNETPLQREIRLAKDAARAADRRRRETSPERRRRLAESAAHTAQKRKMETPEQREQRLAKDAARAAERRRRETETDRQKRLAADAARHASKRSHYRQERDPVNFSSHLEPNNNLFVPNMPLRFYQPEYPPPGQFDMPMPDSRFQSSSCKQKSGTQAHLPTSYQSKYSELLNVIEDLGREIKPTYAGSKMAQERLKKGIMHARDLVRECLAEVEKSSRE